MMITRVSKSNSMYLFVHVIYPNGYTKIKEYDLLPDYSHLEKIVEYYEKHTKKKI